MQPTDFFQQGDMDGWNQLRVNQLVKILGKDWFPGKRVLDVGCGHGNNGRLIQKLGAEVVFTDGRQFFVDFVKEDGYEAYLVDHDTEWTVPGTFDLIVHWGLLYHLKNWKQDLACCFKVAPLICLETEIADVTDLTFEWQRGEIDQYDQALNHIGSVMSANCFQNYVESLDPSLYWDRYDVHELNHPAGSSQGIHFYDWEETDSGFFRQGQRRFWMLERRAALRYGDPFGDPGRPISA